MRIESIVGIEAKLPGRVERGAESVSEPTASEPLAGGQRKRVSVASGLSANLFKAAMGGLRK
jgi:hypothetical protein